LELIQNIKRSSPDKTDIQLSNHDYFFIKGIRNFTKSFKPNDCEIFTYSVNDPSHGKNLFLQSLKIPFWQKKHSPQFIKGATVTLSLILRIFTLLPISITSPANLCPKTVGVLI